MNKRIEGCFVFILAFILLGSSASIVSAADIICPNGNTLASNCSVSPSASTISGGTISTSQDSSATDVAKFNSVFKSNFTLGLKHSTDVKTLQQFLKDQGYYAGKVDGSYGRITDRAVNDFKGDNNIGVQSSIISTPIQTNNLTITTPSNLPNATVGQSYSVNLYTSGCSEACFWDINDKSAAFPILGLGITSSYGSSNHIVGTPGKIYFNGVEATTSQTFTFKVTVTSGSQKVSKDFTLTVDPATTMSTPTVTILSPEKNTISSPTPSAVRWTNSIPIHADATYFVRLTAALGFGGYYAGQTIWSTTLTSAQAMCSASDVCTYPLSTLEKGTYQVLVQNLQNNASDVTTFVVNSSTSSPLSITTSSTLPNGKVGQQYSVNLNGTGGVAPYGWSTSSQSPAPGLSWDSTYCTSLSNCSPITGIPTTAGTYIISVTFSSGSGSGYQNVSKQFTLTVDPTTVKPNPYDVNGDGQVNVADQQILSNTVLGINTTCSTKCDLNGDGQVNVADMQKMANYLTNASTTTTTVALKQAPYISTLSNSSGVAGTYVTIIGSGFTSTGNNVIFGNQGTVATVNSSNDGTLIFKVPYYISCGNKGTGSQLLSCDPAFLPLGNYSISVSNENGTSNAVNFTVTQ